MINLIPVQIILVLIAASYTLFSVFMQRKLIDVDRTYSVRARVNALTKELIEMGKKNESKEAMNVKQDELTKLSMESMKNQMKPMFAILPVFVLLYYVLLPREFSAALQVTVFSAAFSYRTFFIITVFILGLVSSLIISLYDRRRLKLKAAQQSPPPMR